MESLGRLAGGVAHDFNNLLMVILVAARDLQRTEDWNVAREMAEEIVQAGESSAELTAPLLAFSRNQNLATETLDLGARLHGVHRILESLVGGMVRIGIDAPPEPTWIHANAGQVEQVIVNLVVNARDAMPEGGRIDIRIGVLRTTDEDDRVGLPAGNYACLEVEDEGTGIEVAALEHIFEPFFTTKGPEQGTGLGLSTVYGIVKHLGGDIQVRSVPGEGSSFEVLLPLVELAEASAVAPSAQEADAQAISGGNERILLAEDLLGVRAFALRALIDAGYQVDSVADGAEALALLQAGEGGFDLLVTDVAMPHLGGIELARRTAELSPTLPTLFISAYTEEEPPTDGNPSAWLQKPFSRDDLLREVRSLLDGKSPHPASQSG